jgi:hypothetical protein
MTEQNVYRPWDIIKSGLGSRVPLESLGTGYTEWFYHTLLLNQHVFHNSLLLYYNHLDQL